MWFYAAKSRGAATYIPINCLHVYYGIVTILRSLTRGKVRFIPSHLNYIHAYDMGLGDFIMCFVEFAATKVST